MPRGSSIKYQDISGKQLEVLKEAVPSLSRVAVLWRPSNPSYRNLRSRFDDVVKAKKVEVVLTAAENADEISRAFDAMRTSGVNGVLVQADDLFIEQGPRIIALAAAHRLPAVYRIGEQASAGGLIAYGPNIPDMYQRGRQLRRQIAQGRQGERPSGRAADENRAGRQSQDREDARHRNSAGAAGARRRGDRVAVAFTPP